MVVRITPHAAELMREAANTLAHPFDHAAIPEMGGYFITRVENDLPPGMARFLEVGIEGTRYMTYLRCCESVKSK